MYRRNFLRLGAMALLAPMANEVLGYAKPLLRAEARPDDIRVFLGLIDIDHLLRTEGFSWEVSSLWNSRPLWPRLEPIVFPRRLISVITENPISARIVDRPSGACLETDPFEWEVNREVEGYPALFNLKGQMMSCDTATLVHCVGGPGRRLHMQYWINVENIP